MAVADDIAEIEAILKEGASRVTTDGVTVQYDFDSLRKRLAVLKREQDATKRPRIATVNLSGF